MIVCTFFCGEGYNIRIRNHGKSTIFFASGVVDATVSCDGAFFVADAGVVGVPNDFFVVCETDVPKNHHTTMFYEHTLSAAESGKCSCGCAGVRLFFPRTGSSFNTSSMTERLRKE